MLDAFQEFHDPRLVALYDAWDESRRDFDFYLALAAELGAATVVDIGCGTGALACLFAARGLRVTGIDPATAMLEVARARSGGDAVSWLCGDASVYAGPAADLVVMTAHVAQVIADEDAWHATLAAARHGLRPGGHVAFESRNPVAQAWRTWTPEATRRRMTDTPFGAVDAWWELIDVDGDLVRTEIRYRFAATGEELVSSNALRFRSRAAIEREVAEAGFAVERVYGDWDRSPVDAGSPELIFVARRD